MIEAVIYALIVICVIALVGYLVIWVLQQLGVPLPAMVIKILWVIFALICILILWQLFSGAIRMPSLK